MTRRGSSYLYQREGTIRLGGLYVGEQSHWGYIKRIKEWSVSARVRVMCLVLVFQPNSLVNKVFLGMILKNSSHTEP